MLPAPNGRDGTRVLIYGAGDGGELLLREILNNRDLKYSPVGFLDDDPGKSGKVIHGLKVLAANGDLTAVCKQYEVEELLITSSKMSEKRLQEIVLRCNEEEITVRRMRITIEELRPN